MFEKYTDSAVFDTDDIQENLEIGEIEEKPFNKCLTCEYLRNGCSGPNLNAMTVERACEFLQIRRKLLKYSYQKTANLAMLSVPTVKRILSGKVKDPSFLSMQALTFALIADPQGEYPCAMEHFSAETEQALSACQAAQEELSRKVKELEAEKAKVEYREERIRAYQHQDAFKEAQLIEKDKQLTERKEFIKTKDRAIAILSLLLFVALFIIIYALILDMVDPDRGFIWTSFHRSSGVTNYFGL